MLALTYGSLGLLNGNLKIIRISNLSLGKSIPSQNVLVPNKIEFLYFKYQEDLETLTKKLAQYARP